MKIWMAIALVGSLLVVGCGEDTKKGGGSSTQTCGNISLDPGELCDPGITQGEGGACPRECVAPACSTARLVGNPLTCDARCVVEPIACADGDGCCPIGCDNTLDSDCTNVCGDSQVEAPETCDGNCATTCVGSNACQIGELLGDPATCSVRCDYQTQVACVDSDGCCPPGCQGEDSDCGEVALCGNGTLEAGETCDGDCPQSCTSPSACLTGVLRGSAATCDARCDYAAVNVCQSGDGCCPQLCTEANDSDCSGSCGNGIVEGVEKCDGNCPTACNDNIACTIDTLAGSAAGCDAQCVTSPVTACQSGDGCCPSSCNFNNDSDCNCSPSTCQQLGAECGVVDDGCGNALSCGGCTSGACSQNVCVQSAGVGAPCTSDADCGTQGGIELSCLETAPGGYCTAACVPFLGTGECPDGTFCGAVDGTFGCSKRCTSDADCRDGYDCFAGLVPTDLGCSTLSN